MNSIPFAVIVFIGGGCGAVFRWAIQSAFAGLTAITPVGTLVCNLLGCFLAGVCITYVSNSSPQLKLFLFTGFLGALTTWSAFALEVVSIGDAGKMMMALSYWAVTTVVCVLVCGAGFYLGQKLLQ